MRADEGTPGLHGVFPCPGRVSGSGGEAEEVDGPGGGFPGEVGSSEAEVDEGTPRPRELPFPTSLGCVWDPWGLGTMPPAIRLPAQWSDQLETRVQTLARRWQASLLGCTPTTGSRGLAGNGENVKLKPDEVSTVRRCCRNLPLEARQLP